MNYENMTKEELIKVIKELEQKLKCRGRKKKLAEHDKGYILLKYNELGYTMQQLANEYNVSVGLIHKVITKEKSKV